MPPSTVSTTVACALSSAARSSGSRAPTARTGCLLRATTGGRSATWSASSAASARAPIPSTSRSARRPTDASCTSTVAALRRCTPVRGTFSRRSTGAWDSTLSSASRVWTSARPPGPTSPTAPSTSRAPARTLSSWWTSPCTGCTTVVSVSSTARTTPSLSVTKAPTAWTGSSPTTTTSGRSVACTAFSPRASSRPAPTRSASRSAPRRPTTAATSTAAPPPTSTLESGSPPASSTKDAAIQDVCLFVCATQYKGLTLVLVTTLHDLFCRLTTSTSVDDRATWLHLAASPLPLSIQTPDEPHRSGPLPSCRLQNSEQSHHRSSSCTSRSCAVGRSQNPGRAAPLGLRQSHPPPGLQGPTFRQCAHPRSFL
mmetsp:Transcript_61413/g.145243  ORF Transcript_61413/g.145243 Transcript_61413/m.145243 type:complete len:370 (+) Transcript_61413:1054-2163(+)